MQLQIECNNIPFQQKSCWICNQPFETREAKVVICNDQGNDYGEVCPECLEMGFYWLSNRFEQLNQPRKRIAIRQTQDLKTQTLETFVGA
jgi:hypothetical protein